MIAQPEGGIAPFRDVIVSRFPELRDAAFRLMTAGWHSVAVDVDDCLVFKFPRHGVAERALRKEAALLKIIRPAVSLPVPEMQLHHGPPLFSKHVKLKGEHLLGEHYQALSEDRRTSLGEALGCFYAELHCLPPATMEASGAGPVEAWQPPNVIRARAVPALPPELRACAMATVEAFERLPADPYGLTCGFFDGHGWNMAFDHARGCLNGICDFADSGFGPLHQDFIYTNLISPDLTERVVTAYEAMTGRTLDRRRIALLTGVHRLSELAEQADEPEHTASMIQNVIEWTKAVKFQK